MNKYNVLKRFPEVGDFVVKTADGIRFVSCECDKDFIDNLDTPGVVYWHRGRKVGIVGGVNDIVQKWAEVAWWEIESIPAESADCVVTLLNQNAGTFRYEKTSGTIEEFTAQLNEWLKIHAPKWESYYRSGKGYLQFSDYDAYERKVSIGGATLSKKTGEEVAEFYANMSRNQILAKSQYNGMCRARLYDWAHDNTNAYNNPTTEMNGVTQLFITFPVSEIYFNGDFGWKLRERFKTYDAYLDACMARPFEIGNGCMQVRSGKMLCDRMKDTTVLVRGVEKPAYPAVNYAVNYDAGVEGFGSGSWWLPSMSELAILMRDITYNTSKPLDVVNKALNKKTGWSKISSNIIYWSVLSSSSDYSWYYDNFGVCNRYGHFYLRFAVSVVSAFEI